MWKVCYSCVVQALSGNTTSRSGYLFGLEELTPELFAQALPLLRQHWKEVAHFKDIELEPDFKQYELAERSGVLRFYTLRRDWLMADLSPELVGYAAFFVRPNPHYKQSLQAAQDVLYLDPSCRGLPGFRFMAWCDEQLRAEGVEVVRHHLKAAHNHERLMQALGYEVEDIIYCRRLNNGSNGSDVHHLGRVDDLPEPGESGREGAGEGRRAGRARYAGSAKND